MMTTRWIPLLCAAGLLALSAQAQAQTQRPMYKCTDANGKAVFTQMPCTDAKVVGEKKPKTDPKKDPPPQDRARAANRAKLSPEDLQFLFRGT